MSLRQRPDSRQSLSAAAGTSAANNAGAGPLPPSRPSSSLSYARPGSAFGYSAVPKTPSAARLGGFPEGDLRKIQSSIRTAGKSTAPSGRASDAGPSDTHHRHGRRIRASDEMNDIPETSVRGDPAPQGAFISETSFSRAPLNSRLPPISPHRVTLAASSSPRKAGGAAAGRRSRKSSGGSHGAEDADDLWEEGSGEKLGDEIVEEGGKAGGSGEVERTEKESLEGLSDELQEALIIEDLLFVLMGIEGLYIQYDESYSPEDEFERLGGAQFVIDPLLQPWLRDLVAEFLPLAKAYTAVKAFVEQYNVLDLGVINHALCAAIREMLRDYLVLLSELEQQFLVSPTFSLRTMWYLIHPTLHTLTLVHALTSHLSSLNVPTDPSSSSDASDDDSSDSENDNEAMKAMKADMAAARNAIRTSSHWEGGPAKGGEVLQVLSDFLSRTSGDPVAREVYSNLQLKASQPYAAILVAWITTGVLRDPWDEFMVKEAKGITRGNLEEDYVDEYWDRLFTLRDKGVKSGTGDPRTRGLAGGAVVPEYLEKWKWKVMLAGKYLNVIRECGIEIKVPEGEARVEEAEGEVAMNTESFYKRIEDAYIYANGLLLKTLLEDQSLVARLQSIKQYFFFIPADGLDLFLSMLKGEYQKKTRTAAVSKIQSLLELALRSLSFSADPFKDDLKVLLSKTTMIDFLVKVNEVDGNFGGGNNGGSTPRGEGYDALGSGLVAERRREEQQRDERNGKELTVSEALSLDYTVRFPLNLVISKKTILRYQLIFRYLLQLKLLERTLSDLWAEQTKSPFWRQRSPYPELEQWKGRMFALRARMSGFVKALYGFAVGEVLEPNWRGMEKKLDEVETVDGLLKDHVDFLDTCLNALLLTNAKILVLHNKLMTTCTLFASYRGTFTKAIERALENAEAKGAWSSADWTKQWENLSKFEQNFNHHFKTHLERVGFTASRENTALLPLHVRLSNLRLEKEK